MKIHLFHPAHFEKWDYRWPDTYGIGGSETCQVELSWRLARRGFDVHCYAPLPDDAQPHWRGTTWHRLEDFDPEADGLWVLMRCPAMLQYFGHRRPGQPRWLLCQDIDYGEHLTPERTQKLDLILPLCHDHKRHLLKKYPWLIRPMLHVSSNGVRDDLVQESIGHASQRNPYKLLWASSPDRGLLCALAIFRRVREQVPEAEFHVCYGFQNLDQFKGGWNRHIISRIKLEIEQTPGVVHHERLSQPELYRQHATSAVWPYPTEFRETNCITIQEAQCLGAVPVVNPLWAVKEKLRYGYFVRGNPYDNALLMCMHTDAIVEVMSDPDSAEANRQENMELCLEEFSWERVVDQYERLLSSKEVHV